MHLRVLSVHRGLTLILAILYVNSLTAEENPEILDQAIEALATLSESYATVECVHAEVRIASSLSPEYLKVNNIPANEGNWHSIIESFYSEDKWRIGFLSRSDFPNDLQQAAYDGERVYGLFPSEHRINISSPTWVNPSLFYSSSLFFPFAFLYGDSNEDVVLGLPIPLSIVRGFAPHKFRREFQSIKAKSVPQGIQLIIEEPNYTDTVVLSAKRHYYPVSFSRKGHDKFGPIERKFEVTQLTSLNEGEAGVSTKSAPEALFPKKATLAIYRNGNLQRSDVIEVLKIDGKGCNNGDVFSMDPATADAIYDMDSNSVISVPR